MFTLDTYKAPSDTLKYAERMEYYKNIARNAYASSGLLSTSQATNDYSGYVTVEPTPAGDYDKIVKVVFYQNDTHTRRGYHAKYKITEQGLEEI